MSSKLQNLSDINNYLLNCCDAISSVVCVTMAVANYFKC